jgi:hypothetical protein
MGVLEGLHPDAPLLRLPALGREEMARAISNLVDDIQSWRDKGRAWRGRPALARANFQIAEDFSRVLLEGT